jgi:hypothetical protein
MNFIPRKEVVDEKDNVSKVSDAPGGMSRMIRVVVEAYASIVQICARTSELKLGFCIHFYKAAEFPIPNLCNSG